MAEGDEYLDYLNEVLEQAVKPWSTSLGVFRDETAGFEVS